MPLLARCAATKVTNQQPSISVTEELLEPNHIPGYDFPAKAAAVPAHSALASTPASNPSAEHGAHGRQLGTQPATELATALQVTGMPATQV